MTGFAVNIYRWQWHKHITLHGKNCAGGALFSVLVPIRAEHPLALSIWVTPEEVIDGARRASRA